jgi:ArsR family transcriptional regulator, virulence genes transcriptional regulator
MRMDAAELQANARRASALLKAMANERRLMILCHLATGEKSVGEIEALIGLSQSALSQHLARLRRDRLVETRRTAQSIRYRLSGGEVEAILVTLHGLYCAPPAGRAKQSRGRAPAEPRA